MKKVGEWGKVNRTVNRLQSAGQRARSSFLKSWAIRCEEVVRGHIDSQDLSWAPLSERHSAYKAMHGYDANIYIMSGAYRGSITSWVKEDSVSVGIMAGARGQNGVSLDIVARVLEYGAASRNLPARPLWEPSFQEMLEWGDTEKNGPAAIMVDILNSI